MLHCTMLPAHVKTYDAQGQHEPPADVRPIGATHVAAVAVIAIIAIIAMRRIQCAARGPLRTYHGLPGATRRCI